MTLIGEVVGEAPANEENRNDLNEPSEPVGPFSEFEDIGEPERAVRLDIDGRRGPVAEHHNDEGGCSVEIDRTIPALRGLLGQASNGLCDSHDATLGAAV